MKNITLILALLLIGCSLPGYAQPAEREIWSLRACLEYAKEHNLALEIAQLSLQNNDLALTRERAARLPNLNGNSNFQTNYGYTINPFTNQFTSQGNQSFNLGLNANMTLYNGGRITKRITQAEVNQRVAASDLKQAEYDLALNLTLAYLDILRNQELVRMAEIQINTTEQQSSRTAKLVQAGVLAQAEALQLTSQLATDQLALVNARNTLETSYLALMQLLQLDFGQKFGIEDIALDAPNDDLGALRVNDIYEQAEQEQPFIQSADLQVRSASLGQDIAKTGLLPSVTAGANVGTGWASGRILQTGTRPDTNQLVLGLNGQFQSVEIASETPVTSTYNFGSQIRDNINGSAFISLNVPIYNRYQNTAAIQQAEIQRDQASLQAQQARQQLQRDIQTAYVQARSSLSTFQATETQIEALTLTFNNTEKQFNLGVVNSLDFLIAKNNLQRAQNDLVQAKYNYFFRLKVLDFYRGLPIGFGE
jgi:outer membrane protein